MEAVKKYFWKSLNESYGYHDTSMPAPKSKRKWRAFIVAAYQALALEETRKPFKPTLLRLPLSEDDNEEKFAGHGTGFIQCWFPGVHTDVGGGYERAYRDISDISLSWMMDMCSSALVFWDLSEVLKKTTLEPPKKRDPKRAIPTDKGWGLSDTHDESKSPYFIAAGTHIRTPG